VGFNSAFKGLNVPTFQIKVLPPSSWWMNQSESNSLTLRMKGVRPPKRRNLQPLQNAEIQNKAARNWWRTTVKTLKLTSDILIKILYAFVVSPLGVTFPTLLHRITYDLMYTLMEFHKTKLLSSTRGSVH